MISIREAISDLDRAEQRRQRAVDCYAFAIRTSAQYAVELDEELTEPHCRYLQVLAQEVAGGASEAMEESTATFRSLLRDYRDKAARYLSQLRQELASSASALQDILATLNQSDGDYETRLRQEMKRLRDTSACDDIATMRAVVVAAACNIENGVEELRRQHQLTVSQFLAEIRALHQRIDRLENAAARDALTQLFNQAEMEKRILSARDGASVLLIRVHGIRRAESDFDKDVAEELTGAFTKRLRNCLKPTAECGCWGEEQFVTIGPPEKTEAEAAAKWISEHLSGNYACLRMGKTIHAVIEVQAKVVDRPPGADAEPTLAAVREYFAGEDVTAA